MKIKKMIILAILCTSLILQSCRPSVDPDTVNCTEEFRSVRIKVSGEPLTDFYTLRLATSDTIRKKQDELWNNSYPVLDDNDQPLIENKQETFRFIGKRGNVIVVQEDYVIKADRCHIFKVSGK